MHNPTRRKPKVSRQRRLCRITSRMSHAELWLETTSDFMEKQKTPARVGSTDQRLVSQRRETCQWTEDENGLHETECGHAFEFTYDGVQANGFKYCCFCGGSIIVKLANDRAKP